MRYMQTYCSIEISHSKSFEFLVWFSGKWKSKITEENSKRKYPKQFTKSKAEKACSYVENGGLNLAL